MVMASRTSRTYDDIVRRTVPEPDSSFRPSREQERQAFEGFRAMDAGEHALFDRVRDALRDSGLGWEHVAIEVTGDRVHLRGQVTEVEDLERIPALVRDVEGVGSVDDRLVVVPAGAAD
jgi:hypothetical protein